MLGQKRQREVGPLKPIPANPRGNLKPKIATTSSASSTHAQLESDDAATWKARRDMLQAEVDRLVEMEAMQAKDHDSALDAVEQMLSDHARRMDEVRSEMNTAAHQHELAMEAVRAREERCRTRKQQALDSAAVLANSVASLVREHDGLEEELVLQTDVLQQKEESLREAQASTAAEEARLAEHLRAEELASDAGYGLSGEVKEMLDRMAELEKKKKEMELLAMQSELTRRELFAKREELKGSIRVFCRVKGRSTTTSAVMDDGSINNRTSFSSPTTATKPSTAEWLRGQRSPQREASASRGRRQSPSLNASPQRGTDTEASDEGVVADDEDGRRSSTQTTTSLGSERTSTTNTSAVGCGGGVPFSFPASPSSSSMLVQEEGSTMAEKNTIISVHQRRANATSTGTHHSREDFVYDRVFTPDTSQAEVYVDVEPLVHSAVDGYAVCIFAYGQTGSGKTYTMEGQEDATSSEGHGVTPRAMATIFTRMKELGNDGWSFDLSCWFVEVYNDTIRDLCQPPQLYQPESRNNNNAAASSKTASARETKTNVPSGPAASYHTIQHNGDRTSITNVRETQIRTLEDFNKVYAQAVLHRSTARTQLNDRSSRSHCVFSLRINGRNDQLRQRSEGVLCLVDLAGSERVNDSGAEGKELKEAININRSLLDLGKCIHAMRGGGVVPWRNSKLTYLLQNYLGAKGGKMLMIVAVSDQPTHVAESINSLRFAARVSETIVGSAVKRVTNY